MSRSHTVVAIVTALVPLALAWETPAWRSRAQAPATNASPSVNSSPQETLKPQAADPAAATFTSSAGLMFVTVKGEKTADYEAVIRELQSSLSQASDEKHRAIAKGWRVFKSEASTDPKANFVYVHVFEAAVVGTDYRPSVILDELLAGAPADLLGKYRDSIVGAPTKIGLEPFADMTTSPPVNSSPKGPVSSKPPGLR